MPRRKKQYKKLILPDYKFGNILVSKFINQVMRRGKKSVAQRVVYRALDSVSAKTKQNPLDIFDQAIRNVSPILEVKAKRIGGANYQIPIEVRGERKITLALRWIIQAAKERAGKNMAEKLAGEILDAAKKQGGAIKKREDVHRMAEANKAFIHFA